MAAPISAGGSCDSGSPSASPAVIRQVGTLGAARVVRSTGCEALPLTRPAPRPLQLFLLFAILAGAAVGLTGTLPPSPGAHRADAAAAQFVPAPAGCAMSHCDGAMSDLA